MSSKWTNGDSTSKIKYATIRCAMNMINAADARVRYAFHVFAHSRLYFIKF